MNDILQGDLARNFVAALVHIIHPHSGIRKYRDAYHAATDLSPKGDGGILTKSTVRMFLDGHDLPTHFKENILGLFSEIADLENTPKIAGDQAAAFYRDVEAVYDSFNGISTNVAKGYASLKIVTPSILELLTKSPEGVDHISAETNRIITWAENFELQAQELEGQKSNYVSAHKTAEEAAEQAYQKVTEAFQNFTPEQQKAFSEGKSFQDIVTTPGIGLLDRLNPQRITDRETFSKNFTAYEEAYRTHQQAEKAVESAQRDLTSFEERLKAAESEAFQYKSRNTPAFVKRMGDVEPALLSTALKERGVQVRKAIEQEFQNRAEGKHTELQGNAAVVMFYTFREFMRTGETGAKNRVLPQGEYYVANDIWPEFGINRDNPRLSEFALTEHMKARNLPDFLRDNLAGAFQALAGKNEEATVLHGLYAVEALRSIEVVIINSSPNKFLPETTGALANSRHGAFVTSEIVELLMHDLTGKEKYPAGAVQAAREVFDVQAVNQQFSPETGKGAVATAGR